jgi:CDP-Glycerol:Poly(glycerophosphate) glycerophosphotransferase
MTGILTEIKNVQSILSGKWQVIIYAESKSYYQYFEKIIEEIQTIPGTEICYISSGKDDPVFKKGNPSFHPFYVHLMLGYLLPKLKAGVMFITMTDLGNFLFKRSPGVAKYVYVFHALVSIHQQYNHKAFFNYDAFLCAGPHHVAELKRMVELYQLKQKELIEFGYPLVQKLKDKITGTRPAAKTILIAPSWFEGCIFDACIDELVTGVELTGFNVVIRPHPEYRKRKLKNYKALQKKVSGLSNIGFDNNADIFESLCNAALLITDRSGIAFEYFLAARRPVIFINTNKKIMNPNWGDFELLPMEDKYRDKIGYMLELNEVKSISKLIAKIEQQNFDPLPISATIEKEIIFTGVETVSVAVKSLLSK